jgi:hypothetical protein
MMEEGASRPMELNELQDAVGLWLISLKELTEQQAQLEADLAADPRYTQLLFIKESIDKCEERIKNALKSSFIPAVTIQNAGYEAILQTRKGKETLHFDIQAIEQEPTLATCIVKSVNERLFKAVVEAKSLDMSMYCTPEAGTEVKAVIIRKVDDKKP